MFKRQQDRRSEPVRRVVALGESTTWGYSVSSKDACWVSQVVGMLREFQGSEIELINQGIGSNVLTPDCPAYEFSAKPSALERVDGDLIAYRPDLALLSYGLNDSRGGTPPETFRRAYQALIDAYPESQQAAVAREVLGLPPLQRVEARPVETDSTASIETRPTEPDSTASARLEGVESP